MTQRQRSPVELIKKALPSPGGSLMVSVFSFSLEKTFGWNDSSGKFEEYWKIKPMAGSSKHHSGVISNFHSGKVVYSSLHILQNRDIGTLCQNLGSRDFVTI